jgi:hypothetical protein
MTRDEKQVPAVMCLSGVATDGSPAGSVWYAEASCVRLSAEGRAEHCFRVVPRDVEAVAGDEEDLLLVGRVFDPAGVPQDQTFPFRCPCSGTNNGGA